MTASLPRNGNDAMVALLLAFALQSTPAATRELATDLPQGFLPEGVEWDAPRSRFLIGSIREFRIAYVDPSNGRAGAFADAPGSVLGLHVDGGTLWAAWTRFGHGFDHNPASGIAAWSLDGGRALGNWPLPDRDPRTNLGDLLVLDAHTLVASDSGTGAIWRFDVRTHAYTRLIAPGTFRSPQGLAPGRTPDAIYLADYPTGLWRVSLANGDATQLKAPPGSELRGIDGLYRRGGLLIAVQNGTKTPRILALTLGADDTIVRVRRWREMPGEEPGLGTLADGRFWFVTNDQWNEYDDDLRPKAGAALRSPRLRGLPLSELDAAAANAQ
ncbi:MAG: hypothetical protein JSS21_10480 [Proteobacteria bacterium]|nr:hypothetical protein [Pseudomonadota bacterium]